MTSNSMRPWPPRASSSTTWCAIGSTTSSSRRSAAGSAGDQLGRGPRVAAGEQRDLVALANQLLGQVRDDALGAAVARRRHALDERRHLRDAHPHPLIDESRDASAGVVPATAGRPVAPRGRRRQDPGRRAAPDRARPRRAVRPAVEPGRCGRRRWRGVGVAGTPTTRNRFRRCTGRSDDRSPSTAHSPSSPACGTMVVSKRPRASAVDGHRSPSAVPSTE